MSRVVLFVGCSLVQDRTVFVLRHIDQAYPEVAQFAIVPAPASADAFQQRAVFLADCGIRPIWYPSGRHDLIEPLLAHLLSQTDQPGGSVTKPGQIGHGRLPAVQAQGEFLPILTHGEGWSETDTDPSQAPPCDVALLPQPATFVGRAEAFQWIATRLRSTQPVVAITGMSGIGKSALLGHVIRTALPDAYPKGIAVISGRDIMDERTLLRRALARFDPRQSVLKTSDPMDLLDISRRLLSGKQCLIVFDGVEPGCVIDETLRVLRAVGASVVITSQHSEPAPFVPRDARLSLEAPSLSDGVALLAVALGRSATEQAFTEVERPVVERLVNSVEAHPLALELIGAYIADRKLDLVEAASEFSEPSRVLGLPRGETPAPVEAALSGCYAALPANAARVLDTCSEFAAAEFGRGAVQAVAQAIATTQADRMLDALVLRAFLTPQRDPRLPPGADRDRLRLHPLVRALAASHFAERPVMERRAGRLALARYYAEYVTIGGDRVAEARADTVANKDDEIGSFEELLDVDGTDMTRALEWLLSEDAMDVPAEERDLLTERLCAPLIYHWRFHSLTADGLRFAPVGIAASEHLLASSSLEPEDERARHLHISNLHFAYAEALEADGQFDEAQAEFRTCLEIRHRENDWLGEAAALYQIGSLGRLGGNAEEAAALYHESLAIVEKLFATYAEATVRLSLGELELNRSLLEDAQVHLDRADVLASQGGYEGILIEARLSRGRLALTKGELEAAYRLLTEASDIASQQPISVHTCMAIHWLGQLARKRGDVTLAHGRFSESLRLAEAGGYRRQYAIVLNALGNLALEAEQLEEAQRLIEQSLEIARKLGDAQMEGTQLTLLAGIALRLGNLDLAESLALMGNALATQAQHAEDAGFTLLILGQVAMQRKQYMDARRSLEKSIPYFERAGRQDGVRLARAHLVQLPGTPGRSQ